MKKLTSLFLACLLVGITLTSCGTGADKAATTDTSAVKKDTTMPMPAVKDTVKVTDSGTGKPIVPPKG
jgi:ABC-type glycerol-3-phosphate transport system substrate-binding protein